MSLPPARRDSFAIALRRSQPYEEPSFSLVPTTPASEGTGLGRIGTLPAQMSLGDLARRVAEVLPATAHGVRIGGDPDRQVRTVALCGGSGRSEEHTSELQSRGHLVCRLLLENKK